MQLPTYVLEILKVLEDAGFESYIVGGSVRDSLLGKFPKDYDIATQALPEEIKDLFPKTVPTGEKFGTITVLSERPVEVTTFRKDGPYRDSRHPLTVSFSKNLKDDLMRRDFTINAIAYSPKRGYIDPLAGRKDLRAKMIRAIGNKEERFQEDALRSLRAIRFCSTLGEGWLIEETTFKAMKNTAFLVRNISHERITDELIKMINGLLPTKGLILLSEISEKAFGQKLEIVNLESMPPKIELRLSLILQKNPWLSQWLVLPKKTRKHIEIILTDYPLPQNETELRHLCYHVGRDYLDDWLVFRGQKPQAASLRQIPINIEDLAIDGFDVEKLVGKGPVVGDILIELASLVRENPSLNTRESLLKLITHKGEP